MGIKINSTPSLYEAFYILWYGIDFDKDKLIKFVKRMRLTKMLSFIPKYKKEYNILKKVFDSYNHDTLSSLMKNDENIVRLSIIEKCARMGALDLVIHGSFTRDTYRIISNLPIEDYKLILRRVDELMRVAKNTSFQSDNSNFNLPGT